MAPLTVAAGGITILSAVLALMFLMRPSMAAARVGRVLAFLSLFIIPLFALGLGVSDQVERSKTTQFCLSCHVMEPLEPCALWQFMQLNQNVGVTIEFRDFVVVRIGFRNLDFGGTANPARPDADLIWQAQQITAKIEGDWLYARADGVERDGRLLLMELELTEPSLFFALDPGAAARFADAILR